MIRKTMKLFDRVMYFVASHCEHAKKWSRVVDECTDEKEIEFAKAMLEMHIDCERANARCVERMVASGLIE